MNRRWVQEWCQQMDKLQKLKKSFICRFGWKDFPSYYKYIHLHVTFVLEKGGMLLLGTVLLLGHIRYLSIKDTAKISSSYTSHYNQYQTWTTFIVCLGSDSHLVISHIHYFNYNPASISFRYIMQSNNIKKETRHRIHTNIH